MYVQVPMVVVRWTQLKHYPAIQQTGPGLSSRLYSGTVWTCCAGRIPTPCLPLCSRVALLSGLYNDTHTHTHTRYIQAHIHVHVCIYTCTFVNILFVHGTHCHLRHIIFCSFHSLTDPKYLAFLYNDEEHSYDEVYTCTRVLYMSTCVLFLMLSWSDLLVIF